MHFHSNVLQPLKGNSIELWEQICNFLCNLSAQHSQLPINCTVITQRVKRLHGTKVVELRVKLQGCTPPEAVQLPITPSGILHSFHIFRRPYTEQCAVLHNLAHAQ